MENPNTKSEEIEVKEEVKEESKEEVKEESKEEVKVKEEEKKEDIVGKDIYLKKEKNKRKWILRISIFSIIAIVIFIFSTIFSIMNMNNSNILSGIKIEGIDVSGLSKEEAKTKIEMAYNEKKQKDIILKYEDYDVTINPELIEANYNIEEVIEKALLIGKDSNIIINNYSILFAILGKNNLKLDITINEDETKKIIEDIQTNIPGAVEEPNYYIKDDKLIITRGKEGLKVDVKELIKRIKTNLYDINTKNSLIEIPVYSKKPENINIEKIHEEVYKKVQDAYYTKDPFTIHPEIEGIDFDIDEAKKILKEDKEQYEIQLKITKPQITTTQIGLEAFPELISTFSTRYDASQIDRSTNLRIACEKINDKVVLPGETFSYNNTLGERTAAAGYKNAKVYENGMVVDGIGGGICQISSTLYNAILMANMEATERRNHQFVTSYVEAGRDATVVYGITDFKFKNTRNYAIKIKASALNGVATVSIYGIKEEKEYAVSFDVKYLSTIPYSIKYIDDSSLSAGQERVTQKGANGFITETYIIKSLNGKVISKTLLSKDTYNAMQRIVQRGTKETVNTNVSKPIENIQSTEDISQDIPTSVENNGNDKTNSNEEVINNQEITDNGQNSQNNNNEGNDSNPTNDDTENNE